MKENSVLLEINEEKNNLDQLYKKLYTKDFKQTHLINNKKKEIARLLTKLNAKGVDNSGAK